MGATPVSLRGAFMNRTGKDRSRQIAVPGLSISVSTTGKYSAS
jgi:hypothetical protein